MKKQSLFLAMCAVVLGLTPLLSHVHSTQAQSPVEITFVHIYTDDRDVRRTTIQDIADAFMAEHPDVVVNIQSTTDDYGQVFEGALLAANQGNAPDIIQAEDVLTQVAIDSQAFVKIGDYATPEELATIPDIIEPMRNYYDLDNEIWGLPWNASNPVMYYNPDMFTAAGLDPNTPPHTFAEITAACDAIMAAHIDGLGACINWPVNSWLPEQWLSMQNALFVNNDNGRSGRATKAEIDTPEMMKIVSWWKDLADKGYFTYSGNPDAYTSEGLLFISKQTAIHLSSSAGISNMYAFAPSLGGFTPLIAPFPQPDEDSTNGMTPGGAALWVMAGHPDAETQAAVDFVFFLTNSENMAAWHKASGYFPIRQSSIDSLTAEGWFDANPAYFIPLQQLLAASPDAANAGARVGASEQVRTALIDALMSVIDSHEDPAAALAAAQNRADKAIADYNSIIGG